MRGATMPRMGTDHRFPHKLSRFFQCRRIPDLYDLYDLYDLHDLYDLYDIAHAAWWEPYNLHDLEHVFLGWICSRQILHSIS